MDRTLPGDTDSRCCCASKRPRGYGILGVFFFGIALAEAGAMGITKSLPMFDRGFSALLEDMHQRGLLEETFDRRDGRVWPAQTQHRRTPDAQQVAPGNSVTEALITRRDAQHPTMSFARQPMVALIVIGYNPAGNGMIGGRSAPESSRTSSAGVATSGGSDD
jgi:hypothetical protein